MQHILCITLIIYQSGVTKGLTLYQKRRENKKKLCKWKNSRNLDELSNWPLTDPLTDLWRQAKGQLCALTSDSYPVGSRPGPPAAWTSVALLELHHAMTNTFDWLLNCGYSSLQAAGSATWAHHWITAGVNKQLIEGTDFTDTKDKSTHILAGKSHL